MHLRTLRGLQETSTVLQEISRAWTIYFTLELFKNERLKATRLRCLCATGMMMHKSAGKELRRIISSEKGKELIRIISACKDR
jgi:hypothetical protein